MQHSQNICLLKLIEFCFKLVSDLVVVRL